MVLLWTVSASSCLSETAFCKFDLMSLSCYRGRDMGQWLPIYLLLTTHDFIDLDISVSLSISPPLDLFCCSQHSSIALEGDRYMVVPIPLPGSKNTVALSSHTAVQTVRPSSGLDEEEFCGNATYYQCNSLAAPLYILSSVIALHFIALFYIIWYYTPYLLQTHCKDPIYLFSLNSRLSSNLNTRFASHNSRWQNTILDEKWQTAKLVVYPTQPQSLLSQWNLFSTTIKFKQFMLRGKNSFHNFITVVMIPAGVSFKAYSGRSITPCDSLPAFKTKQL